MKAWIENGVVRDVCSGIPADMFHPDIARRYDTEVPPKTANGATLVDGVWVNPVAPPLVPVQGSPVVRHITKLAFRNRFTSPEKTAIEIAQLDDPTAPMAQRAKSAVLRAHQADVAAATYVDLGRQDTRAGVLALEAAGLLATGRAAQILDADVQPEELFRG